jgi:lysozyme
MMTSPAPSTAASPLRRALRWLLILAVLGLTLFALGWYWASRWQPDREQWPIQGVAVGAANGELSWPTLAATGAQFAYIDAVAGGTRAHARFTSEHDAALAAGLRVGAVHHYALCRTASEQAAAFVTLVPREEAALPAAIAIADDPACRRRPTRALLISELTTFLNQVETHLGKSAILAPTAEIDAEFRVTEAINRPRWVIRNWREPDNDAARPWVIWQANDMLESDGASGPVRRLVLNGAGV